MPKGKWQEYKEESGFFKLQIPPDAVINLEVYPTGEKYYTYIQSGGKGNFSILWEAAPGHTAQDMLNLEQELGTSVSIKVSESEVRFGQSVYHLRYQTEEKRSQEMVQDPVSGAITELPSRTVSEVHDYMFWQGKSEVLRVVFRVHADAPSGIASCFSRMLTSFTCLRQLV
ncbi:MAG: hypothetical protein ACYC6L_07355 [Anaerolineae bacterium]